jgi:DegV family protein with EDD domain
MIKIVTDTLACIPQNIADEYQIPIVPQIITFGEESFREGIDMDQRMFLERLKRAKELPKTAAPPPEWFKDIFKKVAQPGETILCIHPSTDLSGTVRSASVAAQDFPGMDIRVVDTRLIAYALGVVVLCAARWAAAGVDADTIVARCEKMHERCDLLFMVDTFEYLVRGGRIGRASGIVGSLLQIKPILMVRNGRTDLYHKERTHRRALEHIKQRVHDFYPGQGDDYGFLHVIHGGAPDAAQKLAGELETEMGVQQVPVIDLPPAVITHGGPGLLGVVFFRKE